MFYKDERFFWVLKHLYLIFVMSKWMLFNQHLNRKSETIILPLKLFFQKSTLVISRCLILFVLFTSLKFTYIVTRIVTWVTSIRLRNFPHFFVMKYKWMFQELLKKPWKSVAWELSFVLERTAVVNREIVKSEVNFDTFSFQFWIFPIEQTSK